MPLAGAFSRADPPPQSQPRHGPPLATPRPPVRHPCRARAPRPSHGTNRAWEHWFDLLRRVPLRAAAGFVAGGSAPPPRAPKAPGPSDLFRTHAIRSKGHQTRAIRSRSERPDSKVPVRPVSFAKEPLSFSRFNPQSISVQKYFQIRPCFYVLHPEFL